MSTAPSFTPVPHRLLITLSVMMATLMQSLDTTIANVALPHMQGSFSATQDQMVWVLTSYIVAAAISIPLTGWLATRFDRKKVFLLSVAGFTISSGLCGVSVNLGQLVLFRLLQGISGAALVPLSQAVLFDINPREQHARAMSFWGIGITAGPILGPVLGGWLTEDYNWRWVFYINMPVGLLAFFGLLLFLPADKHREAKPFDFFGFISLSLGVGALQMLLDLGELNDWFGSTEICVEAVIAAVSFYVFLVHTLSRKQSFINTKLFADANFVVGNVLVFIIGVVLFATLALLPPLLQEVLRYPVLTSGEVMAPRGVGLLIAMIFINRSAGNYDIRYLMAIGLMLISIALYGMAHFSPLMDWTPVVLTGLLQGFGLGLVYVPLAAVAFGTLPDKLRTEGAAFYNLIRNLGSSLGISIVQALLTRNTQVLHSSLASRVLPYNTAANFGLQASGLHLHHLRDLARLNAEITRQGSMIAYLNDFYLMMVITLLMAPLLLLFRRARKSAPEAVVAE